MSLSPCRYHAAVAHPAFKVTEKLKKKASQSQLWPEPPNGHGTPTAILFQLSAHYRHHPVHYHRCPLYSTTATTTPQSLRALCQYCAVDVHTHHALSLNICPLRHKNLMMLQRPGYTETHLLIPHADNSSVAGVYVNGCHCSYLPNDDSSSY